MSAIHAPMFSGGDPYFGYVVSLWDMTSTADLVYGTWAPNENAYLSGGEAVLPTVLSDRYELARTFGNYITLADKYTIEFKVNIVPASAGLYASNNHVFFGVVRDTGGADVPTVGMKTDASGNFSYIWVSINGTYNDSTVVATQGEHHCALVHDTNKLMLFWDGIKIKEITTTGPNAIISSHYLGMKNWMGYNLFECRYDNFRFTNEVARYLTDYTPSTAPFPNS